MTMITGPKGDGGDCAKAFLDDPSTYVNFFPFFRTLSKMVYCSMTQRKENSFRKKVNLGDSQDTELHKDLEAKK